MRPGQRPAAHHPTEWKEDGVSLILPTALDAIFEEIKEERAAGRIRPFVEGEAIGMCETGVLTKRAFDKFVRKVFDEMYYVEPRYEQRQREVVEMRQRNDERIRRLLGEA